MFPCRSLPIQQLHQRIQSRDAAPLCIAQPLTHRHDQPYQPRPFPRQKLCLIFPPIYADDLVRQLLQVNDEELRHAELPRQAARAARLHLLLEGLDDTVVVGWEGAHAQPPYETDVHFKHAEC